MKKINYFWYGLTGFVEGYVPLFTMLTSISVAFALSFFFPPITLIAFFTALFLGAGLSLYHITQARHKHTFMESLETEVHEEVTKKNNLKKQHQQNKEIFEHLIELNNFANKRKLLLRKAYAYSDFIYNKVLHMPHDEREKFLVSGECKQINHLLSQLQKSDLNEKEFEQHAIQLEEIVKPIIGQSGLAEFSQKNQLAIHSSEKKFFEVSQEKSTQSHQTQLKSTAIVSIGVGIKTSLMGFGFACSLAAIAGSTILGMTPAMLIAAAPITVIAISAGLLGAAFALGALTGLIYYKVIAPYKRHNVEMTAKLPAIKQKNHELMDKLTLEKTLLDEQQQTLANTEEDNHFLYAQVQQKAELLHNNLDINYHDAHKLGVKNALHVVNHPKIKDHEIKQKPPTRSASSTALSSGDNQHLDISPQLQKLLSPKKHLKDD